MQGFQTHTAVQPISIQLLQTQQKPCVTEVRYNAEKHSLLVNMDATLSLYQGTSCKKSWIRLTFEEIQRSKFNETSGIHFLVAIFSTFVWNFPDRIVHATWKSAQLNLAAAWITRVNCCAFTIN